MKATIRFEGNLQALTEKGIADRPFVATADIDVTGLDGCTAGEAKELIVRMAVQMTNPATLEQMTEQLSAPIPAAKKPALKLIRGRGAKA